MSERQPVPWTERPSVLWENGNWTQVVPSAAQPRTAMANALARLSILMAILLSLAFGGLLPLGVGILGLYMSTRVIAAAARRPAPAKRANVKRPSARKSTGGRPEPREEATPPPSTSRAHIPSWSDMFGTTMEGGGDAKGAYVGMANSPTYERPDVDPLAPEGTTSANVVPLADVEAYRTGAPVLRSPFPRPQSEEHAHEASAGPWQSQAPYQAGYPTVFGASPSPVSPQPSQQVQPMSGAFANDDVGTGAYQPAEGPVAFGMFQSDGGYSSTPLRPAVPHSTAGQDFATATYAPRQFAPAGPALPTTNMCFAPQSENPLGNPEVFQNRVARPKLCTEDDPRSQSTQFIDSLYESTAQQGAAYNFFPFPVQDVVEARDNYQNFVIKSGLTHFKDKYSNPEDAGRYNFTDFADSPLGY